MGSVLIKFGTVEEVENMFSDGYSNGLRIRARLDTDRSNDKKTIPWAFPLLPKSLQAVPKEGEGVLIIADSVGGFSNSQRYYIGPVISQPQYNTKCSADKGTSLLNHNSENPLPSIDWDDNTRGSFPATKDVALVGRGAEDVILKYDEDSKVSEVDIRAGIRKEGEYRSDNKADYYANKDKFVGNIMFNGIDPAYIQLKYKTSIATGAGHEANSLINIVADRINIMSNKDSNIDHDIHDNNTLVSNVDNVMDKLHPVPMGDKLVEALNIIKGAILHHVHPWASMEQSGDDPGFINDLTDYHFETILSEYVRIS